MDTELKSGLAAMKHAAGDTVTRQNDDEEANKKGDTTAAAKRNDDKAADKENDTMAAARQDDDEMRDKRSNMTKERDNDMTTAGCYQGPVEMSAFPIELGREVPRNKMMTREQEDLKHTAEEPWNNPRRYETNW